MGEIFQRITKNDTVLLAFVCHGKKGGLFLEYDKKHNYLLEKKWLMGVINKLKAKAIFTLLNACYSGRDVNLQKGNSGEYGVKVVLTSTNADNTGYSSRTRGACHILDEIVSNQADISLDELYRRFKNEVNKKARSSANLAENCRANGNANKLPNPMMHHNLGKRRRLSADAHPVFRRLVAMLDDLE